MAEGSAKPCKEFRIGRHAKVVIWDNGDKGFAVSINRPSYKDDAGQWKETSFWYIDLPGLAHAVMLAAKWIEDNDKDRTPF